MHFDQWTKDNVKPSEVVRAVRDLADELRNRRTDIVQAEEFYQGQQPLTFASSEWESFHSAQFTNFSDNWCGVVGSSPAERLKVDGFRLGSAVDPISSDEKWLWEQWNLNELEAQSSQGFLQSIIAKRSNVLVWPGDDDEPVVSWEHPGQSIVGYDPIRFRKRVTALKLWDDGEFQYADLWTRHTHIRLKGARVSNLILPESSWEIEETKENPYGLVPLVEFSNRPMLSGEALSDIQGTMAMQNAINLLWAYLFSAADFASLPARVVMGQEPPSIPILDDKGQVIGSKPVDMDKLSKTRLMYFSGKDAKIGQWDAAKLDVFTEVINVAVKHVAAQSRTPIHYIVGELNNVNGETLLAGETGLVKKVEEFQQNANPELREMFRLIAKVGGKNDLADACRLGRPIWANAQTATLAQASDAALKDRQVGLSFEWIAENRYGLTPEEIERELQRKKSENDMLLSLPELQVKSDESELSASSPLEV